MYKRQVPVGREGRAPQRLAAVAKPLGVESLLQADIDAPVRVGDDSQVQGEDDLQVLESVRSLSSNVAECHEKLIVKEELKIPDAMGNISELLWWDAFLCSKEVQLMTDQAMVRGELEISVLYTTEESDTQVYCLQQRIPFSGMLDGLGIAPGMKCELQMQPEKPSVRIGPDDDGELRVFDTETLCDCVLRVYEEKEQHFVQDLYMPSWRIECDRLQTVLNGIAKSLTLFIYLQMISALVI